MKRVFIISIISICLVTGIVLGASSVFGTIAEDGYAVPASSGITQNLSGSGRDPVSLVEVSYEDVVYEKATGFYVGDKGTGIDISYPLYTNGGVGIRFLADDNWLITTEVDLYQTFEGLYVSEGVTYNEDMTRADDDEFILIALANGLYMNAQHATLNTHLGSTVLPANSILNFTEEKLTWYAQKGSALSYHSEEALFEATITIGSHTYRYTDLLDALGLIREAIEQDDSKPDPEKLDQADQILNPKDNSSAGNAGSTQQAGGGTGDTAGGESSSDVQSGDPSGTNAGGQPEGVQPGSGDNGDAAGGDDTTGDNGKGETDKEDGSGDGKEEDGNGGEGNGEGKPGESGGEEIVPDGTPASARVTLSASKTLDGKTPELSGIFSFILTDAEGNPLQVRNNDAGSVGFDPLVFDAEGVYTYTIYEEPGSDTNIVYDDTRYTVVITVTKAENVLEAEVSYLKDGEAYEGMPVFENTTKSGEDEPDEPGGDDEPGEPGNPGEPGDSDDSGDGGDSEEPPYQEPVVTFEDIEAWSYALDIDMAVDDPSNAIPRGVKISVFKGLKGRGETYKDEDGHTCYSSEDYEGKSTALRKTRYGSQSFALSPLQPGQTVYVQYSYRYNAEVTDEATGVVTETRRYYYSDLIEVTLPDVESGNVQAVGAQWDVKFAAEADALQMDGLKIANTSDYNAETETYDFENFKLNTLPYVSKMELILTPEKGDPITVSVGSSILARAQEEGGTVFTSASPKLESNTKYTYKAVLKDRYGNELPMKIGETDSGKFTGIVYTRKATPVVTITEEENVTDSLTLKFKVSDPDNALDSSKPLRFSMVSNADGTASGLDGTWDKDKVAKEAGSDTILLLQKPKDGSEYEITLTSLAFSRLFSAQVTGDYAPQPDSVRDGETLSPVKDALLGNLQVYTASLSSGYIGFNTNFTNLLDTSVTVNATMNQNTSLDILELVDEYRITLTDASGKVVSNTVLNGDDLKDSSKYVYDAAQKMYVLEEGDALTPRVVLYGEETSNQGNAWNSFCIAQAPQDPDNPGESAFTRPMQLQVSMPKGSLTNNTAYNLSIKAVVIKSGEEYDDITISLTNTKFTTKKTIPEIRYDDMFLAADIAEFLNLRIYDPDKTIQNDGAVTVYLYLGDTLLSMQKITASPDEAAEGVNLRFEGLIPDAEYTLKFVADAYNDEEGYGAYKTNHVLETYNIIGGSALNGTLTLTELGSNGTVGDNLVNTAQFIPQSYVVQSGSGGKFASMAATDTDKNVYWATYYMTCEPNTTYLIDFPVAMRAAWTDESAETVGTWKKEDTEFYSDRVFGYQDCSVYKQKLITTGDSAQTLLISVNDTDISKEDSEAHQYADRRLRVHKYDESSVGEDTNAEILVDVLDTYGYLGRAGENGQVKLTIEQSDSMEQPEYKTYKEYDLTLNKNADGSLSLSEAVSLADLPENKGWRGTLTATYQGSEVLLDQITFRTDADYVTVSTHKELIAAMTMDPNANILVNSDFVQDQNTYAAVDFNGTIDFQGHVVTRAENITTYFIRTIGNDGCVKNLVYDFPQSGYYLIHGSIFFEINGLAENLIVRTNGQTELNHAIIATNIPQGTLRNFVVRLGGDVTVNAEGATVGVVATSVNGTASDGYIYGVNGAGIIHVGTNYSSLFPSVRSGTIQRIYAVADSWYRDGMPGQMLISQYTTGNLSRHGNIYMVGDQYQINVGESKNYWMPLSRLKIMGEAGAGPENIWAIPSRNYTSAMDSATKIGETAKLYDVEWQESMLGSAFDVAGCVSMGFYPRLNLPDSMQKYQEYRSLPVLGEQSAPELISDSWADESIYGEPELDNGHIRLRFKNDNNYRITDVTIEGLVTSVQSAEPTSDGFYDVVLSAAVDPTSPEYVSSYKVTRFGYNVGSVKRERVVDYTTTEIEFWKEVADAEDWAEIDRNMDWNYKLTADINLATLSQFGVIVDGNPGSTGTGAFNGKIDGQEHVITGINLAGSSGNGTDNAYVIYSLYGSVKNLFVENMTLNSSGGSDCGFFRRTYQSANVNNVRFRNCTVTGGANLGVMAGTVSSSRIVNCSVTDSYVYDRDNGNAVTAGGLVGYAAGSYEKCYTRNVQINVTQSVVVQSVGGLMGYNGGGGKGIYDCYTQGSIYTGASYVGGIYGKGTSGDTGYLSRCISYADIQQTGGDYAGGLANGVCSVTSHTIVLGNVSGAGEHTARVAGSRSYTGHGKNVYAYAGQKVTGVQEGELDDALALVTGEELSRASGWQDIVRLGSEWNYAVVSQGFLPLIKTDCDRSEWQQQGIPLPGQTGDPTLQVEEAVYDDSYSKYGIIAKLVHPGFSHEQMKELYNNKMLTVELDGFDINDANLELGKAAVEMRPVNGEEEASYIRIEVSHEIMRKALDTYPLIVSYTETGGGQQRTLSQQVEFKDRAGNVHRNYHKVPDLATWKKLIDEGHGNTEENFLITGMIDFEGQGTDSKYWNLRFGRLEGEDKGTCGFKSMKFVGDREGVPWIEKVSVNLGNLTFSDLNFSFTSVEQIRSRTAPILAVSNAKALKLENITMIAGQKSRSYFGFISTATGTIEDVEMKTIRVEDGQRELWGNYNYTAGLVAFTYGDVTNVVAENISVNMPNNSRVAGIIGSTDGKVNVSDISIEGLDILGSTNVGGVAGYCVSYPTKTRVIGTENMNSVEGRSTVAGISGAGYGHVSDECRVENMKITATEGSVGGMFGSHHLTLQNSIVKDCIITGVTYVGGVMSGGAGSNTSVGLYNVEVTGCTIRSEANADVDDGSYAVGGVIGHLSSTSALTAGGVTVDNCEISGSAYVGGFAGGLNHTQVLNISLNRVYVAEDVSVTAKYDSAGGLIGSTHQAVLSNCASGATVSAGGSNAGGIIGKVELWGGLELRVTLDKVYYKGSVSAAENYAGGLIGKLNSNSVKYDITSLKNCLVSGDVRTVGEKASLWINYTAAGGNAGTGTVYINEDSLLNGQTAKALVTNQGGSHIIYPPQADGKDMLIAASEFNKQELYEKTLGFAANYWDYTHIGDSGNKYMPYTKNSGGTGVLESTKEGITLPEADVTEKKTVVYASGINTVNIETGTASPGVVNVNADGNSYQYTTNENGVATIYYDFRTDFTVDGVGYKAAELNRQVLTAGDYWYHIAKDDTVHYGSTVTDKNSGNDGTEYKEKGSVSGIDNVIHLWQGNALTEDGKIYSLNGNTASEVVMPDTGVTFTQRAEAKPYYTDNASGAQVYYYFSLKSGVRLDFRIFSTGDRTYTISPSQKAVHDGVLVSRQVEAGASSYYFSYLGENGEISTFITDMNMGGSANQGIDHMSNNFNYSGTIALLCYKDDRVEGINYATGDRFLVCPEQQTTFFSYLSSTFSGLFKSGDGVLSPEDDSYLESEKLQAKLEEELERNEAGDGASSDYEGGALGGGTATGGTENGNTGPGSDQAAEISGSGEQAEAAGTFTGEAGELSGETGELTGQTGELSGESGEVNGEAGALIGETGELTGETGISAEGAGGAYAEGTEGAAAGSAGLTPEQAAVRELGSSMLVYSPETGKYEVMETESLVEGKPKELEKILAAAEKEAAADGRETVDQDGFSVTGGFGRGLYTSEKQGFALIAAAAGIGLIGLILLYVMVIRKRRR